VRGEKRPTLGGLRSKRSIGAIYLDGRGEVSILRENYFFSGRAGPRDSRAQLRGRADRDQFPKGHGRIISAKAFFAFGQGPDSMNLISAKVVLEHDKDFACKRLFGEGIVIGQGGGRTKNTGRKEEKKEGKREGKKGKRKEKKKRAACAKQMNMEVKALGEQEDEKPAGNKIA